MSGVKWIDVGRFAASLFVVSVTDILLCDAFGGEPNFDSAVTLAAMLTVIRAVRETAGRQHD